MGTREANQLLIEREIGAGVVHVASRPFDIIYSSEHRCGLRCIMCWSTVERNQGGLPLMDRKLPNDTLERFRKLADQIVYWGSLSLTGSGEPLLSPALPEILALVGPHPVATTLNTHGNLLDPKRAEMLVRNGLKAISISMDAACRETYERIRVPAKWDKLLAGIANLTAAKARLASASPRITYAGNFMRQNIEELPALVDFAAAHGGAAVLATNTVIYDPAMEREALVHYPELTREMALEAQRRARRLGIEFVNRLFDLPAEPTPLPSQRRSLWQVAIQIARRLPGPVRRVLTVVRDRAAVYWTPSIAPPAPAPTPAEPAPEPAAPSPLQRPAILRACQMPWKGLMVESEGSVKVCCFTSPYVGNLNQQSFDEIWNGAPLQALRRSFLEGAPPEGCRTCFIFMQHQEHEAREALFFKPLAQDEAEARRVTAEQRNSRRMSPTPPASA